MKKLLKLTAVASLMVASSTYAGGLPVPAALSQGALPTLGALPNLGAVPNAGALSLPVFHTNYGSPCVICGYVTGLPGDSTDGQVNSTLNGLNQTLSGLTISIVGATDPVSDGINKIIFSATGGGTPSPPAPRKIVDQLNTALRGAGVPVQAPTQNYSN